MSKSRRQDFKASRGAESTRSRILLDARPLQGPSALRGIGRYARGLLEGLLQEGFEDRVSLLLDRGLPQPELPPGRWRLELTARRYRGRLAVYEDAVATNLDLERLRPALFHALALTLPGRARCPLVVTLHDLIPWALGGRRLLGERVRYWPARRLLRRADLVLAVSEATAGDARRLLGIAPQRLRVVPEGVDPALSPRAEAAAGVRERWGLERPFFLYVGALDARKDPRALLAAWRVAREAGADCDLVLAGEPGPQAPAELEGGRRLGYVSDEELAQLLSAAVCLLFPTRYEGFGLPALEAMACGCPVLAYSNSSLPELVGEAGILVPDGDHRALGQAAARLALDRALARRLGEAGRLRAQGYTWRRAARLTIGAYRSLLDD